MFKKVFNPTDCYVEAETKTVFRFADTDSFECDELTIRLMSPADVELARVHVVRVPSSYKPTASAIAGIYYMMGPVMSAYSRDLDYVATQMELNKMHPSVYASKQLRDSDLYHILNFAVSPMFRDCGIEEWLYENINTMIRKICREDVPVCTFLCHDDEPTPIDPTCDKLATAGWNPVVQGSRAWYLL